MKLNELLSNSLNDLLQETNVTSVKPISDDDGNIKKIIVEYVPIGGNNEKTDYKF